MQPEMKEPENPDEATQIRAREWQCDVLYELRKTRHESYMDVVGKLLDGSIDVPENYRDLVSIHNPEDIQQIRVTKGQRWEMYNMKGDGLNSYSEVITHLLDENVA